MIEKSSISIKSAAASRVCRVSHQKDRLDNYGLSHGVNDFLKQTSRKKRTFIP